MKTVDATRQRKSQSQSKNKSHSNGASRGFRPDGILDGVHSLGTSQSNSCASEQSSRSGTSRRC